MKVPVWSFCVVLMLSKYQVLFGQAQIPIGTWRLHLSFNDAISIAEGDPQIFAATRSGVLVYNRTTGALTSLNTLNALSGTGISALGYNKAGQQLIVAYEDGNLDIVTHNEVLNFPRFKESSGIIGSRRINRVVVRNNLAYLAADFGIAVFDLTAQELRETWRNLGEGGDQIAVFDIAFLGDSVFAATSNGIISGDLGNNLLDFSHWQHDNDGPLGGNIAAVVVFQGSVYAAIDGIDLFIKVGSQWTPTGDFPAVDFKSLSASATRMVVTAGSSVWAIENSGPPILISSNLIIQPNTALHSGANEYWIADAQNGLISNASGSFASYLPNGPTVVHAYRMEVIGDALYVCAGGFQNGLPNGNRGRIDVFDEGVWSSQTLPIDDVTDFASVGETFFASSFGEGIVQAVGGDTTLIGTENSTLASGMVTAIHAADNALWVINYGNQPSLHRFREGNWTSFSTLTSSIADFVSDLFGNIWLIPDPSVGSGIVVFDVENDQQRFLTTGQGTGGLPHARVNAIDVDKEGYVWVGTNTGIAYFYDHNADAVRPIFEGRFLLQGETITAIKTDGGNRKWIATTNGVWLFDALGETLIQRFTSDSSPLLSNTVTDIEIHPKTGEVFFATDKGIVSYRSDATESDGKFRHIKIFPNPVNIGYAGLVGIEGLASNAVVKITDARGRLVWETRANGGTAAWDLRDYNGKRVAVGVYVVFAATEDGSERTVGKIAVVE